MNNANLNWMRAGAEADFPRDGGVVVKLGNRQIAVYRFENETDTWYACDNVCPHQNEAVLGRGIIGDKKGEPVVACPMHKKVFSLKSGNCISDAGYSVNVYPVQLKDGSVFVMVHETASNAESFPAEQKVR